MTCCLGVSRIYCYLCFFRLSRERSVYATHAHVFQIDPQTKKKWLPSSTQAVRVSYYYDPSRKTYRIITMENKEVDHHCCVFKFSQLNSLSPLSQVLINSTITANMTFTKTSPKFGQWSDHRANTVFGLGFSSEKDLIQVTHPPTHLSTVQIVRIHNTTQIRSLYSIQLS